MMAKQGIVAMAVVLATMQTASAQRKAKPKSDADAFIGTWRMVSIERGGKKIRDHRLQWNAVIRRGKTGRPIWRWVGKDAPNGDQIFVIGINPKAKPKSIDLSFGGPGSSVLCSYAFAKGGGLKIHLGKNVGGPNFTKRPKTFRTAGGDDTEVWTLKRIVKGN